MKKFFKVLGSIFSWILIVALVAVMASTVILSLTIDSGNNELFGYKYFIARSDAMSTTDYRPGDLIFCKSCDTASLVPGDIITYSLYSAEGTREFVTHQIRETTFDAEGKAAFITFSTRTDQNDDYIVPAAAVVGKYMGYVSELGSFLDFALSPAGYMAFMIVPFIIIVLIVSLKYVLSVRRNNRRQSQIITDERMQLSDQKARYADAKREIEILSAKIKEMDSAPNNGYADQDTYRYNYQDDNNYAYPAYEDYIDPAPQDYNGEQYDQNPEYPQYPENGYPGYGPYNSNEGNYNEQYPEEYTENLPQQENLYAQPVYEQPQQMKQPVRYEQFEQINPESTAIDRPPYSEPEEVIDNNNYYASNPAFSPQPEPIPERIPEPMPKPMPEPMPKPGQSYIDEERVLKEGYSAAKKAETSNLEEISRLLQVGQAQTTPKPAEPAKPSESVRHSAKKPTVKVKAAKKPEPDTEPQPQIKAAPQEQGAREEQSSHRSVTVRRVRGH